MLTDSRKITFPAASIFFALSGQRRNGAAFIDEVYERGVKNFVLQSASLNGINIKPDANYLLVDDVLQALQTLAMQHRQQFSYDVIGITGSNGKTIVKEWLNQLLSSIVIEGKTMYNIVRSPRSYNSQIGVPLSVWEMQPKHNLAIFEAGISTTNEMQRLQKIIKPTIGLLTNIGFAHSNGFANNKEKLIEKLQLFTQAKQLIVNGDEPWLLDTVYQNYRGNLFTWGKQQHNTLCITQTIITSTTTKLQAQYAQQQLQITIPFTDEISIANACTCWALMLLLNINNAAIQASMLQLHSVDMRMQLTAIRNNCYLLNDSYSNDITSFDLALNYLCSKAGNQRKAVIVSDFIDVAETDEQRIKQTFLPSLITNNVQKVIAIGSQLAALQAAAQAVGISFHNFSSTEAFLNNTSVSFFKDEYILLKGARAFGFERINKWLQQKTHQTIVEINLNALVHNLKEYQKHLLPTTKTMAMVKAFSYGSGSVEIARVLQFHKIDYLGVAYADEGVDLRKANITSPIMILNVDEENFDALIEYNLEPEIFSFNIYQKFHQYLLQQGITHFPVHIKFNTGMNRLGFEVSDATAIAQLIASNNTMVVQSVLSHLVASEDAELNNFTQQQVQQFTQAYSTMQQIIDYDFIKHIANSAAIFKHPSCQLNMVRVGIGLYGVDSSSDNQLSLQTVASLKTTIAQIRTVKAGDSVGYNKKGIVRHDSRIATVRMGYADGLSRSLSNGNGSMFLHGKLAPIVGNVCMDMTMIDVTHIAEAQEDDVVEIFGRHLPVQQVAAWSNTIAYETLSTISQRVRRVYVEE